MVHFANLRACFVRFNVLIGLLVLALASPADAQRAGSQRAAASPQAISQVFNASESILNASAFREKLSPQARSVSFQFRPQVIDPDGEAAPSDWPYTVAIGTQDGAGFRSFCGGVVIAPRRVLTAAHCAKHVVRGSTKVYWGGVNLNQINSSRLAVVSDFFVHDNYANPDQTNFDFDAAVLTLSSAVKAPSAPLGGGVTDGEQLIVMGWGSTTPTGGAGGSYTPSAKLLFAKVNVIPLAECARAYQRGSKAQAVTQRMFCASAPGKDSCSGDSGGPIVRRTSSGTWQVVGLVSFGESCALKEYPGVYTDISRLDGWLSRFVSNPVASTPRAGTVVVR